MILVILKDCPSCAIIKSKFPNWTPRFYSDCSASEINFIKEQMKKYKMDKFPVAYNEELTRFYTADDIVRLLSVL